MTLPLGKYTDIYFQQAGKSPGHAAGGEVRVELPNPARLFASVQWTMDPAKVEDRRYIASARNAQGQQVAMKVRLTVVGQWQGMPAVACIFEEQAGGAAAAAGAMQLGNVTDATSYWSIANYVGQGFNVYGACDMSSTTGLLFNYPDALGHDFNLQGQTFHIPLSVLGVDDSSSYFTHASGSTRESYQDSLATQANVQVGIGAFSGDVKASFSREFSTASEFAFDKYSFYTQLGHLDLRIDPGNLAAPLLKAIDALPDHANPDNLQPFAAFFEQYGVYFVWRVIFGGSIDLYTSVNKASQLSTQDISVEAEASYGALFKAGMKVATSTRREAFEQNASSHIVAIGGSAETAARLALVDAASPSAATVALFGDWVKSVVNSPAPVDFRLKGIWELCGDKRAAVQTAWDLYAQQMHPRLTIQTYGYPAPASLPIITLGRQLRPDGAPPPASVRGGWQLIVLDRRDVLSKAGVRFDRYYSFADASGNDILSTYDQMVSDLRATGCADGDHLLIAVSHGLQENWGPTGSFLGLLNACGGSLRNLNLAQAGDVGSGNSSFSNYMLVGAFDSGTGMGVDYASGSVISAEPHVLNPVMQVVFYRDSVGAPYSFAQAGVS